MRPGVNHLTTFFSAWFLAVPLVFAVKLQCTILIIGTAVPLFTSLLNHGLSWFMGGVPMISSLDRYVCLVLALFMAGGTYNTKTTWISASVLMLVAGLIYAFKLDYVNHRHPSANPTLWHVCLHAVAALAITLAIKGCESDDWTKPCGVCD